MIKRQYLDKHGFILLPVVLILTILAAMAFLISRQSAINAGGVVREMQTDTARYVAEAGYNHALWQLKQTGCATYTDLANIPFGPHNYSATYTPTSGSPVSISATSTHAQGASYNIHRDRVKVYQTTTTVTLQLGTDPGKDAINFEFTFL